MYAWDAFFSYKRDRESNAWHDKVKQKICHWTSHELGRDVKIFFDTDDIPTGSRWPTRLTDALRSSRCLLCVWSPLYFRSRWCVSEWQSFVQREEKVNQRLIIPASYFDGKNFPERARHTQFLDFSNYASTLPRFWDTELAVEFEKHLRQFSVELADAIRKAPRFDPDFPVYEADSSELQGDDDIGRIADV